MGHPRLGLGLSDPAGCDAWLLPYPLSRDTDVFHQGSVMPKEPGIAHCSPWPAGADPADPAPAALISSDFSS